MAGEGARGERCRRHDLALAPDGSCVVCRRETTRAGNTGAGTSRNVAWSVAVPAVVLALGAALYLLRPTTPSATPAPELRSVTAEPEQPEPQAPEPDRAARQEARHALEDLGQAGPNATERMLDDPVQPTPEAKPVTSAREQERSAREAQRSREQLELEAKRALSRVEVTMYSTSWCGVCRRARGLLQASGIRFRDFDVEQNEAARRRMQQLNPKGGVPTIDVDGDVLVGFSPESMSRTLAHAVEKRLARR